MKHRAYLEEHVVETGATRKYAGEGLEALLRGHPIRAKDRTGSTRIVVRPGPTVNRVQTICGTSVLR